VAPPGQEGGRRRTGAAGDAAREHLMAAQAIAKYGGFVIIDHFSPAAVYPLLVLRQNIYTDPQKPIQVQRVFMRSIIQTRIPVLVTTNSASPTSRSANEVEGRPARLAGVTDAEGMSVLNRLGGRQIDAERIAKAIKGFNVADKVSANAWSSRGTWRCCPRVGSRVTRLGNPGWPARSRRFAAFMKQGCKD